MEIKKTRLYVGSLAVDVFYKRSIDFCSKKQAVVALQGFPDFVGPNALTYLLSSEDYIVFHPHLIGTFDSEGEFSPEGIKKSFSLLNILIWDSRGSKYPGASEETFPWKIDSLVLSGHSFGGMLVIRYFTWLNQVDKILLTSPALHYGKEYGCYEEGVEHYLSVKKAYPYTYRLSSINAWDGILEGVDCLPNRTLGNVSKLMVIYGEKDKYFNLKIVSNTINTLLDSYIEAKNKELHIVEGVGHPLSEILDKDIARRLIVDFLKR